MRSKFILILLIATCSTKLIACQCIEEIGRNFLSNVKKFDAIVIGTFKTAEEIFESSLRVEKVFKGKINSTEIQLLAGGTDCMHSLGFEDGTKLLIGLIKSPYSDHPYSFMASGCVTSALIIENEKAFGPERQTHIKKTKIGAISRKMSLKRLERRIKSKV